jgi:biopolymer transport protein ExbD
MKRFAKCSVVILAFVFVTGISLAFAQTVFKIPFEFQAGGKKLPKGEYTVAIKGDGQLVLRQESTGKEIPVPVLKKLEQPKPPLAEPRLVFDEAGDFAPSYTEYMTVYILAEVWLPGQDGLEVHVTKGAHKNQVVTGQITKK